MASSQVQVSETPPMSQEDLKTLAKNETDENGLILGKFKSVEDLAASYKELEGKLGSVTEEDQPKEESPEKEEVNFDAKEYYGEGLAGVLEEVGINAEDITQRFTDSGEISEDDYSKLGKAGFSKQVVDTYLDGLKGESTANSEELAEQAVQDIRDSVGGEESYSKMVSWAMENLPKQEVEGFNEATKTMTAPQLKLMVQGLYTQYQNAMGVEPNLVTGRPASSGPNPYRSTAEVVTAMSDPRYGKDVTYTEDVQRRLGGSSVFG